MNLNEVNQILAYVQNFDNRKITDAMVEAWHDLLRDMPFEFARQGVIEALKADEVKWLEPRHIFKFTKPLVDRDLARQKQEAAMQEAEQAKQTSTPAPKCGHGFRLVDCLTCCKTLTLTHDNHGNIDIRNCKLCIQLMRSESIPVKVAK